jgi:hypothetical protein
MTKTYADLFATAPESWGLRGDPHLWAELASHFGTAPVPNRAAELQAAIEQAIAALTGASLDGPDSHFVAHYERGGMSGGSISIDFWTNTAIPLLLGRARAQAPRTHDYFAELYVAGVFGDAGWAVYFPKRDVGFDFIVSNEIAGPVVLRPVQVKGLYPTAERRDRDVYGFAGSLSAVHPDMVLAMPFFAAGGRGTAPACVAYMPFGRIRDRASGGVRCVPRRLREGVPTPRPSMARYFDQDGLAAIEEPGWSISTS